MQNLIQLGLNKPEIYPLLTKVLDHNLLINHLALGNIEQISHPDGETRLYNYTQKCERDAAWDAVTTTCNGLVVRDNHVIARPYPKVFGRNTPGLPETHSDYFRLGAEVTDLIDGVQAVLYEDMRGSKQLVTRHGFVTKACAWASQWYRMRYSKASWPDGYTPVFQIVGPGFRRVIEYKEDNLILVALVKNADGTELLYGDMSDWAGYNDMRVVEYWNYPQDKALISTSKHRGFVFKWDQSGGPPLRVAVDAPNYGRLRRTMESVTPLELWKVLSEQGTLDGLKYGVPQEMLAWLGNWEHKLRTARDMAELKARTAVNDLKLRSFDLSQKERKEAIADLRMNLDKTPEILPIAIAVLNAREPSSVDRYAWQVAKKLAMGQKGYLGI